MNWDSVAKSVIPYIFKIETPRGHGTGFFCHYFEVANAVVVATAYHVVEHSHKWEQPIRFILASGESVLFKHPDYAILSNQNTDSALIIVPQMSLHAAKINLPETLLNLLPPTQTLPIGCEVAWMGYPSIAPDNLCFFSGAISAWLEYRKAYLIDGVAINGVSGGPVMFQNADLGCQIIGFITAYIPNRATGEAAPGLSVAQDVSYLLRTIATIKSIEDAQKRQNELVQHQAADGPAGANPSQESAAPSGIETKPEDSTNRANK